MAILPRAFSFLPISQLAPSGHLQPVAAHQILPFERLVLGAKRKSQAASFR